MPAKEAAYHAKYEGEEHVGFLTAAGKKFGMSRLDMVRDAYTFYRLNALSDPNYEPALAKEKREAAEVKLAEKQAKALERSEAKAERTKAKAERAEVKKAKAAEREIKQAERAAKAKIRDEGLAAQKKASTTT